MKFSLNWTLNSSYSVPYIFNLGHRWLEWDRWMFIEQMIEKTETQLKQAQITAVCPMNGCHHLVLWWLWHLDKRDKRPRFKLDKGRSRIGPTVLGWRDVFYVDWNHDFSGICQWFDSVGEIRLRQRGWQTMKLSFDPNQRHKDSPKNDKDRWQPHRYCFCQSKSGTKLYWSILQNKTPWAIASSRALWVFTILSNHSIGIFLLPDFK